MSDFVDFFEDFEQDYGIYEFDDQTAYLETILQKFTPRNMDKWNENLTNQFQNKAKERFTKKTSLVTKAKEFIIEKGLKFTAAKEKTIKSANDKLFSGKKMSKSESNAIKSFVFSLSAQYQKNEGLSKEEASTKAWKFAKTRDV